MPSQFRSLPASTNAVAAGLLLAICSIAHLGADEPEPDNQRASPSAPVKLTEAQCRRLRERDGWRLEAIKLRGAGKYAEALVLADKMVAVDRDIFGATHPLVGQSLPLVAELHVKLRDLTAARRVAREVLDLQKAWYGDKHWRVTDAKLALERIDRLAALDPKQRERLEAIDGKMLGYIVERRYEEALPTFQERLKLEKELLGDKYQDLTAFLVIGSQVQMRSPQKAEAVFREYADFCKNTRGEPHPEYARALIQLGVVLNQRGARAEAIKTFDQAAAIDIDQLTAFDLDYAVWVMHLGRMEGALVHQSGMAEALCRQAADIYTTCRGDHDPQLADCLSLLGQLQYQRGAYAQAETLFKQVIDIQKIAKGDHSREYASALGALAMVYHAKREPELARPLLEKAERIQKLTATGANQPAASAAEIRAEITRLTATEKSAEATELCRKLIDIDRKTIGAKHPDYMMDLWRLAANLQSNGKPKEAEDAYLDLAEAAKTIYGPTHSWYRNAREGLARLYTNKKDYAAAMLVYQELESLYRESEGERGFRFAYTLDQEGHVLEVQGKVPEAIALYEKALPIYRQSLGNGTLMFCARLFALAELYDRLGQSHRAEPLMREGLRSQEAMIADLCTVQSESQRFNSLRLARSYLDRYLWASRNSEPALAYDHVLRWKGVAQSRPLERWVRGQPELKGLFEKLAGASAKLTQMAFTSAEPGREENWLRELRTLRNDKENLESEIARQSDVFRYEARQRQLQSDDIARALPVNAALIDFIEYRGPQREVRLAAFVLRHDKSAVRIEIEGYDNIRYRIQSARAMLLQGRDDPRWLADVRDKLWKPIEACVAGSVWVLVAPDADLAQLPLAMLPGQKPNSWLIEDYAISYVTAGRQVLEIFGTPGPKESRGLLAVGGIDYAAETKAGAPGGAAVMIDARTRAGFMPLPGTELEARHCRDVFSKSFAGERATLLTASEPTTDRLRRELADAYRYMHLATHGFFESARNLGTFVSAQRPPGSLAANRQAEAFEMLPMLRSGLALAGAGRAPAPGALVRDPGVLTAEEVASFDLRGTDLVVLSACDTGLGEIEAGQGVLGLQRAFQQAGARTLVTTLWSVDDAATSLLMDQFYRNLWLRHMAKLEALRQAQITILRDPKAIETRRAELTKAIPATRSAKRAVGVAADAAAGGDRSPAVFWAAFVLSGDPR